MKRALTAFVTTVFSIVATTCVLAADLTVTCSSHDGCKTSGDAPFFLSENIVPNFTVTKQIKAINNYEEARQFAIELVSNNFDDSTPSLADKLEVKIAKDTNVLYGPKSISDWKNDGYIILTTIPANHSEEYDLTVSLKEVGSDYQNKTMKFDLSLGFEAIPAIAGTSTKNTILEKLLAPILGTASERTNDATPSGNVLGAASSSGQTSGSVSNGLRWELWLLPLPLIVLLLIWLRSRNH